MKLNKFSKMFFRNAEQCADFLGVGRSYFKKIATSREIVQQEHGGWIYKGKVYFFNPQTILMEIGGCYTANTGDESNGQI